MELAIKLGSLRMQTRVVEVMLQEAVNAELAAHRGSLRAMARKMGFSAQYLCDVRKGRRPISQTFLMRMNRLDPEGE